MDSRRTDAASVRAWKVGFAPRAAPVRGGWSGGAVLRESDSHVIGVVVTSRNQYGHLGGYFVPIAVVAQAFPELTSDVIPEKIHLQDDRGDVFALLSWRTRLSPLIGTQAQAELGKLRAWATGGPNVPSIRLLTGPGGAGKTRLAWELVTVIRREGGIAEFFPGIGLSENCDLLIVDYPEEHREEVDKLARTLANMRRRIRVLFLSRRSLEEWHNDLGAAHARHLVDQQSVALNRLSSDEVIELYRAISSSLAARLSQNVSDAADAEIRSWADSNALHMLPLFVIAVAVQSVLDGKGALRLSTREVIQALVNREIDRLAAASQSVGFRPNAAPRLAALAAVRDGIDAETLRRFAAPALELGLSSPSYVVDDAWRHQLC